MLSRRPQISCDIPCITQLPPNRSTTIRNICCIGAGYVGGPTCAVIASKNPDIKVNVVDRNEHRIKAWLSDNLPITEPGLLDIVQVGRDGADGRVPNLCFSTSVEQAIIDADLVFIAVNTPTKSSGYGANQALDIAYVESAVETIARVATTDKIIVEKSTVPCGTSKSVKEILISLCQPGVRFDVLSNPEFLAEGTAVRNLLQPDRILIGADATERGSHAGSLLSHIYESWVSQDRIIHMNLQSAELAKLAANALLAQRISSINALSAICEETGADVEEVALACGLDTRIGPRMLKASIGFGGSCLKKDVLTLAHFSDALGLAPIGSYWRSVHTINEFQKCRFAERIVKRMNYTLIGKRIAVLGCAFKKDTSDIRESAAISLLTTLMAERTQIALYDPKVQPEELIDTLAHSSGLSISEIRSKIEICASAYTACDQAHAVVIATEWDEFSNRNSQLNCPWNSKTILARSTTVQDASESDGSYSGSSGSPISSAGDTENSFSEDFSEHTKLNWARVADNMKHPRLVFDGRNVVDQHCLQALGLQVEMIGKPKAQRLHRS